MKLNSASVKTKDGPFSDYCFVQYPPSISALFWTILTQTSLPAPYFVPFYF